MNAHRLLCIGVTTFVLAVSSSLRAADGDAEWQKVTDVIEGIKNPKEKPKSREEAIARLKTSLAEFDEAYAVAMKASTTNPVALERRRVQYQGRKITRHRRRTAGRERDSGA